MWFGHQETRSEQLLRQMRERAAEMADALPSVEVDELDAARTLGWISLAIAATELAAPQHVERLLGLPPDKQRQGAIRALGVRELGHGISILGEDRPNKQLAASLWGRVAGDVLDTVALGKASHHTKAPGQFLAISAMVAAIGIADLWCAARVSAEA
ncbi:MAG TPA: hypothetical protein VGR35_03270 [Tepidisphaeraceae bacterium]|nr:hypothetical protein [Tepidisphaeraceae bacterium]